MSSRGDRGSRSSTLACVSGQRAVRAKVDKSARTVDETPELRLPRLGDQRFLEHDLVHEHLNVGSVAAVGESLDCQSSAEDRVTATATVRQQVEQ